MKKTIFLIALAVSLTACEKEQELVRPEGVPEGYVPVRKVDGKVLWGPEDMDANDCCDTANDGTTCGGCTMKRGGGDE